MNGLSCFIQIFTALKNNCYNEQIKPGPSLFIIIEFDFCVKWIGQVQQRSRKSPKKRKHLKRATGGTVGLFTRDLSDRFLAETSPIESDNWFGHLVTTLEAGFPDISIEDDNSQNANILGTGEYLSLSLSNLTWKNE